MLFLASLVVAGIMMAYGEPGGRVAGRVLDRLAGRVNGARVHKLITATIRSVAVGVIGVAFVQALLLGVGFALAGIPAAGLLALVGAMLLGIAQVPALVVFATGHRVLVVDGRCVDREQRRVDHLSPRRGDVRQRTGAACSVGASIRRCSSS